MLGWTGYSVLATIGMSLLNTKTVSIPAGYSCPKIVDPAEFQDKFAITQRGTSLSVKRVDSMQGWGMHLQFSCTTGSFFPG